MKKWNLIKKNSLILVAVAAMLATTACGRSSSSNYSAHKSDYASSGMSAAMTEEAAVDYDGLYDEFEMAEEAMEVPVSSNGSDVQAEQVKDNGRKLIRTYSLSAETLEFQKLVSDVEAKVNALGGYIESSDVGVTSYKKGTHYASYTIRIPKDKAPSFVQHISEAANVTDKTESVEDVTLAYVDLDSHKKALQTEYNRLIELLEQAETVEDIITLEDRLSSVRYQIESMESQLRTYDNKIDYSTIYLNISEVEQITEPEKVTFGGRLAEGLTENFTDVGNSIVDFIVWFITALPYWIMLAVFVLIVIGIVKLCKKSAAKRRQKAWEKQQKMLAAQANASAQVNVPVAVKEAAADKESAPVQIDKKEEKED